MIPLQFLIINLNYLKAQRDNIYNSTESFQNNLFFDNAPGPCIMLIHLVRNSTSARFAEKKPSIFTYCEFIQLVQVKKNYVLSKNSLNANFALSEMQFQKLLYVGTWLIKYIGKKSQDHCQVSQPWTKIVLCIFQVCHVCANFLWFVN